MKWLFLALALAVVPASAKETPVDSVHSLSLTRLDGAPLAGTSLAGKVVLFVNVASRCGYTPQYDGLEKLFEAKKDAGLVIVGVPCNQFGAQEPGTSEEIASFCRLNYGVTFPLLEKQDVKGANRSPLYGFLVGSGPDIQWNFEKILVDRTGKVIGRFGSKVAPDAPALVQAIDAAL